MANTYSIGDLAREFDLTTRAKRLGLSLNEAKDPNEMYDRPRDTVPAFSKFWMVLEGHRQQLQAQLTELQATLDEIKTHEKEARALLAKSTKRTSEIRRMLIGRELFAETS